MSIFSEIVRAISGAVVKVGEIITAAVNEALSRVIAFLQASIAFMTWMVNVVYPHIVHYIQENIQGWVETWGRVIHQFITNVSNFITNVYRTVQEYITNVYNVVEETIYQTVTNVYNTFTNVYTTVREYVTQNIFNTYEYVTNVIGLTQQAVTDLIYRLFPSDFIKDPVGYILAAIKPVWVWNLILGYLDGLVREYYEQHPEEAA